MRDVRGLITLSSPNQRRVYQRSYLATAVKGGGENGGGEGLGIYKEFILLRRLRSYSMYFEKKAPACPEFWQSGGTVFGMRFVSKREKGEDRGSAPQHAIGLLAEC